MAKALLKQGKVRDIYELPDNRLLIVATDRISAFDAVMRQEIPKRGEILTRLSEFWFKFLEEKEIVKTHFISASGREMIVKKAKVIPVEWIVRGYLAGSAWQRFREWGMGASIPKDAKEGSRLHFPLVGFTTKVETGHDKDLSYDGMQKLVEKWLKENNFYSKYVGSVQYRADEQGIGMRPVGEWCSGHIIGTCLAIYEAAAKYAESRGIIIADTKFEFGLDEEGNLLLADEVLTPDSSRFWLKKDWRPGKHQDGYDKQPLRDWLEKKRWDKISSPPNLPRGLIKKVSKRYKEVLKKLIP